MPKQQGITLTLTKRRDGRWTKKINGQVRIWSDPDAARRDLIALAALMENPAALAAPAAPDAGVTVREVCNAWVAERQILMTAGKITPGTFDDNRKACEAFIGDLETWRPAAPDPVSLLRRNVPVALLKPHHFRHIRDAWSQRWGAWSLTRAVVDARAAFRWAHEIKRMVPSMPWWADEFRPASKSEKRAEKKRREQVRGERRFTPAEIASILGAVTGNVRAWVLLALNTGMYSRDLALLRWRDIRIVGRSWIIDSIRNKTQILQIAPLWPETIAELQRYGPGKPDEHVFTTPAGGPYYTERAVFDDEGRVVKVVRHDAIARAFTRAIEPLKIKRDGINFGAFRATHVSATATHPDANSRKVVRGHQVEGIESHYDYQDVSRLKSVTDLARAALLKSTKARRSGNCRRGKAQSAQVGKSAA